MLEILKGNRFLKIALALYLLFLIPVLSTSCSSSKRIEPSEELKTTFLQVDSIIQETKDRGSAGPYFSSDVPGLLDTLMVQIARYKDKADSTRMKVKIDTISNDFPSIIIDAESLGPNSSPDMVQTFISDWERMKEDIEFVFGPMESPGE